MGTVTVKINLDKTGYSAGITDTRRQAKQLADSLKAAGAEGASSIGAAQKGAAQLGESLKSAGAHGVTSMQAASGAIRLLEGGLQGNIRAAERFIGLIPGLSTGLQAAFPIVGAIAFGGALVKIGTEVSEFIKKAEGMPREITAAFESLTLSAQATNDELNVSNDKIENQIAKLEHKPENNLKLALDEAKVSADQFAKSVETAANAMEQLIEKNSISALQGFITDTAPTKALAGTIKPFEVDKQHFATQAAIGKSLGDNSRYDLNTKAFHDKEEAELEKMLAVLQDAQKKQLEMVGVNKVNQDQTPTMTMAQGVIDQIQLSRAGEVSRGTRAKDDAQLAKDQKATQAAADAKKAQEEAKKVQAQLLKQDEEQEKQQNAFNKMSINEEIQFWNDRMAAFTGGSEQYIAVQDKIYDFIAKRPSLFSENKKNQAEAGKSAVEGSDILSNAQKTLITGPAIEQMERATKSNEKYNQITAANAEIQAKSTAAFRESSIAIALQEGTISKLAAAQELAKVHADEHAAALARVNQELKEQIDLIRGDPNLKGDDQYRAIRNAQAGAGNQTTQLNGAYAVTRQSDAAHIYQNTSSGMASDTVRNMLQDWGNMTQSITQAMVKAADSLNDDLAKLITGQGKKGDFGHTFSQLGESLVKSSLQKGESMLFGGSKKPTGAKGDPIHTVPDGSGHALINGNDLFRPFIGGHPGQSGAGGGSNAQTPGGFLGGLLQGLAGGIGEPDGGPRGDGAPAPAGGFTGFLGNMAGILLHSLQGFAGGGDVLANYPAIVGERGPEMFIPHTAGRIVPNHALGGGDTHTHIHVDARGSNDPAAIEAAVRRAAPHIVAASMQAHHSSSKRSPGGR